MIDSHCHLDHEPMYSDLKNVIYRLGYTFGGNNFSDLSYGMGYVIGPFFGSKIELDLAFSLKNSILINRAQGLDFAFGIIWSR